MKNGGKRKHKKTKRHRRNDNDLDVDVDVDVDIDIDVDMDSDRRRNPRNKNPNRNNRRESRNRNDRNRNRKVYDNPDGNGLEYNRQHNRPQQGQHYDFDQNLDKPMIQSTAILCPQMQQDHRSGHKKHGKGKLKGKSIGKFAKSAGELAILPLTASYDAMTKGKGKSHGKANHGCANQKQHPSKNKNDHAKHKHKSAKNKDPLKDLSAMNSKDKAIALSSILSAASVSLPVPTITVTATATEIIAFANFRTRTKPTTMTEALTLTATQIDAYEVIRTKTVANTRTELDTVTTTVVSVSTEVMPLSLSFTEILSVTVPSLQMVTQDNYYTVTVKEPAFTTVTSIPPAITEISVSALLQTVTETVTTTAKPVEVFVSTTVVKF